MKKKWLFFILGFQLSIVPVWCSNQETSNKIKSSSDDELCLNLADFLYESEDLPTSLYLYNQLINKKEIAECYDENYVKALYRAASLYVQVDINKTIEINKKIQIHDKMLSSVEINSGYLTMNVPSEMREEKEFFMNMLVSAGLCESADDIQYSNGEIKIKLKGCPCQILQNFGKDFSPPTKTK